MKLLRGLILRSLCLTCFHLNTDLFDAQKRVDRFDPITIRSLLQKNMRVMQCHIAVS